MTYVFLISFLFADQKVIESVQMLYTQQQNQKAYNAVMQCIDSIQSKSLFEDCWSFLSSRPSTVYKTKVKSFFTQKCGEFNYSHKQMKQLNCSKTQIYNEKINAYKKNDVVFIDN